MPSFARPPIRRRRILNIPLPTPHLHLPDYMAEYARLYPYRRPNEDGSDHYIAVVPLDVEVYINDVYHRLKSENLNKKLFQMAQSAQLIVIGIYQQNFLNFDLLGQHLVRDYFNARQYVEKLELVDEAEVNNDTDGQNFFFEIHPVPNLNPNPMPTDNATDISLLGNLNGALVDLLDFTYMLLHDDELPQRIRSICRQLRQRHLRQAAAA